MNALDYIVLGAILETPGITMPEVAKRASNATDIDSRTYGQQRATSQSIAKLRKLGLIVDVAERCPTCGGARTRGKRNVPLNLTEAGIRAYDTLR
jgi:hypothetical protein